MDVWRDLGKLLPFIITKEDEVSFLDEVDLFSLKYASIVKEHTSSGANIIKRWKLLQDDYPLLYLIAEALLTIPYSTSIEGFLSSETKLLKTPSRNRLSTENLEARIMSIQYFRNQTPKILPVMVERYETKWDTKKAEE